MKCGSRFLQHLLHIGRKWLEAAKKNTSIDLEKYKDNIYQTEDGLIKEHVMNNMPAFIMSGLSASSSMMTGIGFAILLSMIWNKEIGCFFFLGYVLSKYMSLPTVAIAIIAAVIAITYFCNEKKINDVLKIAEKSGASSSVGEEDLF